jgi:tRNA pseudouridine32 synthase/23S rRNA pseudouridine746 synthase
MHRLDRETAGLLLLAIKREARPHYHRMFAEGQVVREYRALARVPVGLRETHWRIENRLEPGEPWFRQRIVEGPVNAITDIELSEQAAGIGRFTLIPKTGRKHQLRVHMASIGCPIVGDPFYPTISERQADHPPLQLLACRLAFRDPITGEARSFSSVKQM